MHRLNRFFRSEILSDSTLVAAFRLVIRAICTWPESPQQQGSVELDTAFYYRAQLAICEMISTAVVGHFQDSLAHGRGYPDGQRRDQVRISSAHFRNLLQSHTEGGRNAHRPAINQSVWLTWTSWKDESDNRRNTFIRRDRT